MPAGARRISACFTSLTLAILLPSASRAQPTACAGNTAFQIGSGIYDITGPAAEIGMMGYGKTEQKTAGIHQRLRARAFVIASPCNGKRIAFVSTDLGQLFQGVKQQVVQQLRGFGGGGYTDANVILSATHTHSGPGGYSHYALYNLTSFGYDRQNFDAIVYGIVQSIMRAHNNLAAGTVRMNTGDLPGVGLNRSIEAYRANPFPELSQYGTDTTDRTMTLLRLTGADGGEVGAINWFAVHSTSMSNTNHLISGDNKGYASYLFEKWKATNYAAPKTFVAAFAQSNEGDVSPNVYGGRDGRGGSEEEATRRSGRAQYEKARSLYEAATQSLVGGVDYRHTYVKMDAVTVAARFGEGTARATCKAAIGVSMIAGAEDGPGFELFGYRPVSEGRNCDAIMRQSPNFVCPPVADACHGQKPVLLRSGLMAPFPWTPEVLPVQLVTIGNLVLIAVPFEATTMAGRRLRQTVLAQLAPTGVTHAVIAGLANAYAGYVTTPQEYGTQHYEGASTHFGPWTLGALQQEAEKLAIALRTGAATAAGPTPRDLRNNQTTLQTGVVFDDKPIGTSFGSVATDANLSYARNQIVVVRFWAGHPKNNLRTQGSFLQVQRKTGTSWTTVASDWDWETKFRWNRPTGCVACSHATVEWTIPANAVPGVYRIRHDGHWKSGITQAITAYTGHTREFTVF
jgi:neutral ceramidase